MSKVSDIILADEKFNKLQKKIEIQNNLYNKVTNSFGTIEDYTNTMNKLQKTISLHQTFSSNVFDAMKSVARGLASFPDTNINFFNTYTINQKQYDILQNTIYDSIQPKIISYFEYNFSSIENAIKRAEEWRALNSLLAENYWIVLNNELLDILQEKETKDVDEIEHTIIEYYLNDNCSKLKKQISEYENKEYYKNRKSIIDSCFLVLEKVPLNGAITVIIPTLLTQISGLYEGISSLVPQKEKILIGNTLKSKTPALYCPATNSCKKQKGCTFVKPSNSSLPKKISNEYVKMVAHSVYYNAFVSIIEKIFANGDKVTSMQEKDSKSAKNIYRNPIMHGYQTQYASKNNLIRCFLNLIFLLKLYSILSIKQQENTGND